MISGFIAIPSSKVALEEKDETSSSLVLEATVIALAALAGEL